MASDMITVRVPEALLRLMPKVSTAKGKGRSAFVNEAIRAKLIAEGKLPPEPRRRAPRKDPASEVPPDMLD